MTDRVYDVERLTSQADEYTHCQLDMWNIGKDNPAYVHLYVAVFNSHLAYLLNTPPQIIPTRIVRNNTALIPEPEDPTREELITLLDDILQHIYVRGREIPIQLQERIENALIRPEYNKS